MNKENTKTNYESRIKIYSYCIENDIQFEVENETIIFTNSEYDKKEFSYKFEDGFVYYNNQCSNLNFFEFIEKYQIRKK